MTARHRAIAEGEGCQGCGPRRPEARSCLSGTHSDSDDDEWCDRAEATDGEDDSLDEAGERDVSSDDERLDCHEAGALSHMDPDGLSGRGNDMHMSRAYPPR